MSAEQAQILEDVGVEMMKRQDERAMKVLSLSLAFKFAKPAAPELPDNVRPLYPDVTHAGDNWSRKVPSA
jgi:hypothetical protein